MTVSRETSGRLILYKQQLIQWNRKINLVSPRDLDSLEERHIQDCLQLARLAPDGVSSWVDMGSGGGLPGLIVAIALADRDIRFILIESDQRKAEFLRHVIRMTGLDHAEVRAERIEAVDPLNASVVSARALAPLPRLMPYLERHLSPSGRAFLMKGRQWQSEVEEARKNWQFACSVHQSETQDGAAVLEISGVSHGTA